MTDELGDTRDLINLGREHPAEKKTDPKEREDRVQRRGRIMLIAGLAVFVGGYIAVLVSALATNNDQFKNPTSELFATISFIMLISLGTALVAAGTAERRERPLRSMVRQLIAEVRQARVEQKLTQERLDLIIGLVSPVPGRLTQIEDTIAGVPEYGRGVIDGMQLRADALGPTDE